MSINLAAALRRAIGAGMEFAPGLSPPRGGRLPVKDPPELRREAGMMQV